MRARGDQLSRRNSTLGTIVTCRASLHVDGLRITVDRRGVARRTRTQAEGLNAIGLVYGDQPLGWDIIGRKESVRAVTREEFLAYLGRWYKPARMVVGVGGQLGDDLVPMLEGKLGDLPDEPAVAQLETPSVDGNARVKLHHKESDQAHIILGAPSYPLTHPDRYALQLLATVLGGGMSSRLWTEVRERRALGYYIFGINNSYTDTGSLYAQSGVDIARIDAAVRTIADQFKRIADEPVPAEELEKARNFAKGRFVLQLESPHGTIMFGLRREVLEGKATEPSDVLEALDAVTAEDVQRVAQDVLGNNGLKLAAIGPFDDPDRFERLLTSA